MIQSFLFKTTSIMRLKQKYRINAKFIVENIEPFGRYAPGE